MRKLLILLGLTLFWANSSTESKEQYNTQDSIEMSKLDYNVAIKFMDDYIVYNNKLRRTVKLTDWVNNRQDVTLQFKNELQKILLEAQKDSPEFGLGFDPIFDAQDYPDKFEIDKINTDYVTVKGISWSDFKVVMRLKLEGEKCLVAGAGIVNIPEDEQRKK